jgi:outer membrane protein assembly factor BamA
VPLYQDGGGDIKLEANTELRLKFNKYLEGAVFVDAGNTWTYYAGAQFSDDPNASKFTGDFYKQIAIGTGIGIRIDAAGYFLIRLDLATPLRKPYQTNGSNWVINQINFGSRDWRQLNLIPVIGIGYPF